MPSAMKQSVLGFSYLPKSSPADAIIIDDSSEEDGFSTPPPVPLQLAKSGNAIAVEIVHNRTPSSHLEYVAKGTSLPSSKDKDDSLATTKKAANANKKKEAASKSLPSKNRSVLAPGPSSGQLREEKEEEEDTGSESVLCHQHRSRCKTLLRCTVKRADGTRCPNKFCYQTLYGVYKQKPEQIVKAGRNILGVDVKEHVGPEVVNYLWKCPKCRGTCHCSNCRKKRGLEPLGRVDDGRPSGVSSSSKRPANEGATGEKKSKKAALAAETPAKHSEGVPLKSAKTNILFPLKTTNTASTSQAPLNQPVTKPKAALQQQTFRKPIRKPKMVEAPQLLSMETRLPVPNILERMWLYESLIRFDWLNIPKLVLTQLDKFDDWTEGQVQSILETLICRIADVSSIKMTPIRKIHKNLVESHRFTGNDLARGESWDAAKKFCELRGGRIVELESVEIQSHQKGGGRKSARQGGFTPVETLLAGRLTRSRRLAETLAVERVKAISRAEMESSEESELSDESEESEVDEDSDEEEPRNSKRESVRRSARQKGIAVAKETSSEDDMSGDEENETKERDSSASVVEQEEVTEPAAPIFAPPFEQRVAILSGLMDHLMQSKQVNEEVTFGFKQVLELEKASKEEEREMVRKHEEAMQVQNAKAPSMAMVEEYSQWKEEKQELSKKQAYTLLDLRVHTYLQIEAHKSRSGPLGIDSDGNEFWQLSEYVERKPDDISGKWAWSLMVLGSSLYQPPPYKEVPNTAPLTEIRAESIEVNQNVNLKEKERESAEDGILVVVDIPSRSLSLKKSEDRSEKMQTPEIDMKIPPLVDVSGEKEMEREEQKEEHQTGFSRASDFETISRLIDYIQYRLELHEYEELLEARKKWEAALSNASGLIDGDVTMQLDNASTSSLAPASSAIIPDESASLSTVEDQKKREKAELKEKHGERRKEVESLIKKLDAVRQYYKWHDGDSSEE